MLTIVEPRIPLKTYRFHFEAAQPMRLPDYPGSAWRGALGHALKRTVCVVRNTPCGNCMLKQACAYSYVFETPPPPQSEKMRKYSATPHPFVLRFDTQTDSSESYAVDLILFGHGQRFFPYIVHAMKTAGADGIGGHRQRFELHTIDEIAFQGQSHTVYSQGALMQQSPMHSPVVPSMPQNIKLMLKTPMRIKKEQKNLGVDDFNFAAFFGNLLRRISMISYFHTDTALETNFAELMAQARTVEFIDKQLQWFDWTRYSSRQQTEMNLGGVVGHLYLNMTGLEAFWPYLWLGQWTHAGKATSMGLGAYVIESASLPH